MIYVAYVAVAVALLVVLVVLIAALKPSDFRVERTLPISASPASLFPFINDLKRFQEWSPYREKDLNARNEFEGPEKGPGAAFRWDGNDNVGAGIMTISGNVPDSHVDIDLQFLRPFPGKSKVRFSLIPGAGDTIVSWSLTGRHTLVPKIFGLFMNMDKMIGGDFEVGLKRLKSLAEAR